MYVPHSGVFARERRANPDEVGGEMDRALRGETRAADQSAVVSLPLTMQNLQRYFPFPTELEKLLYRDEGQGWYNGQGNHYESFYTEQTPESGIHIVTRRVVPATLGCRYEDQMVLLQEFARQRDLDPNQNRCRKSLPVEIVLRFLVHLLLNNERFYTNPYEYDRTDVLSSSHGNPVFVGFGTAYGLSVLAGRDALDNVGSALVRSSGLVLNT
ncbi:MAG: hypothetical protein WC862_04900 [Patescibacteria group bacterium]